LVHWADGGPTRLTGLILLCRAHHTTVHDRRWLMRNPFDLFVVKHSLSAVVPPSCRRRSGRDVSALVDPDDFAGLSGSVASAMVFVLIQGKGCAKSRDASGFRD
jgi:hypothetical protein